MFNAHVTPRELRRMSMTEIERALLWWNERQQQADRG